MLRLIVILPIALFAGLIGVMVSLLTDEDRNSDLSRLPSPLIGKPAPAFKLPAVANSVPGGFSTEDLKGRVSIVNVFASWCVPCLAEHPMISQLAGQGVAVYGINHRDKPEAATAWLQRHGNPYIAVGADWNARASLDWGVTGVPETFIIDADGVVTYKHVGPVTKDVLRNKILPRLRKTEVR
ncbi:MAG: DsbE family thiol:disulfide interchange protein [Alphaproteobacteria bacterium]|nr:DsbE family thiol:disulfide interchange protein [Alphaproteobacteria bacterium]